MDSSKAAAAQPGYNRLRDLIRTDIIEGHLASGSRLKIGDLAARYSSSGIPVREALQQLQGEGVVIFTPNRGARVRHIDEQFLRNIHEIRAVVEPYLIRWFARHRSDAQLARLEGLQREYDVAADAGDMIGWTSINRRFHDVCYDAHYNVEARAVAERHNDLIRAIATRFPPTRSRALQVRREHWELIDRIRRHDEEGAARILEEHVRHAGQHMIERILAVGWAQLQVPRERPERAPAPAISPLASAQPVLAAAAEEA